MTEEGTLHLDREYDMVYDTASRADVHTSSKAGPHNSDEAGAVRTSNSQCQESSQEYYTMAFRVGHTPQTVGERVQV